MTKSSRKPVTPLRLSAGSSTNRAHPASPRVLEAVPVHPNSGLGQTVLKRAVSFPALLASVLVIARFVFLRQFILDPDVWWHIKVGQTILATHHWPKADTYSFTAPGTPWMAYEWLGDTLLGASQRAWGLRGLMALDLGLCAGILLALYALASLRSRNSKAAFVACGLLLLFTGVSFTLRPQMLGYLFLILTLIILERLRQGRAGTLWLLPPLFLVWVNTHGSFVIGLLAFGVYGVSGLVKIRWGGLESFAWTAAQRIRLGLVFAASLIALAVTPYGTRLVLYPFDMAFSQPVNVANIREWQPLPFNDPWGKLFLALLLGFLLAQTALRLTWHLAEFTLFLIGAAMACLHLRFILAFVPFSAPLFAVILGRWIPPYEAGKDKHVLNALLMIAIAVATIRLFPSQKELKSLVAQHWPVRAVQYVKQYSLPRPMYNTYSFGGYLVYALDGENKVFIDGRGDIYERTGVLADYLSIERVAPNAFPLLRLYNVQSCLIKRDEPLATLLSASSEWQKVYSDDLSVLFVRRQVERRKIEIRKSKIET